MQCVVLACLTLAVAEGKPSIQHEWLYGADMSELAVEDCYGSCSPYHSSYNTLNETEDALSILKKNGYNTIRMRIWNNPNNDPSTSNGQYCNITNVLYMARRVVLDHNLSFLLDFHYSDTWADPGHQIKPKSWSNITGGTELITAVYNYTSKVLTLLKEQNTLPKYVQIGNEIHSGMLWAENGQPCDYGGYIEDPCTSNWNYFAQLVNAGCQATRDVGGDLIEIIIHTSLGNTLGNGNSAVNYIKYWYNNLLNVYSVSFDSIGLSFYLGYCGEECSINSLYLLKDLMRNESFSGLNGGLYVAETSFPYNPNVSYNWNCSEFDFTPQGQLKYVQTLKNLVDSRNVYKLYGFSWWGTEYYQSAQSYWQSLWDWNGVALPALVHGLN